MPQYPEPAIVESLPMTARISTRGCRVVDARARGAADSRTHADAHPRVTVFRVILSEAMNRIERQKDNSVGQFESRSRVSGFHKGGRSARSDVDQMSTNRD